MDFIAWVMRRQVRKSTAGLPKKRLDPSMECGGDELSGDRAGAGARARCRSGKEDMSTSNSKKQKAKPVDRATPVIRKATGRDGDKITVTRSTTTAMKQAPLWNTTPSLQAAVTTWNTAADSIESNAKAIADLRAQLATLDATQRTHRQDWRVA